MNRTKFYRSFLSLAVVVMLASLLTSPAVAGANPQASGHGNFTFNSLKRTFSFTAVQHADGSVTGAAEVKNRYSGFNGKLKVDCLKVEGNTAVISGPYTESSDPTDAGKIALFAVEDNGEGQAAQPDRFTGLFTIEPTDSCSNYGFSDFNDFLVPSEAGNIQVKP